MTTSVNKQTIAALKVKSVQEERLTSFNQIKSSGFTPIIFGAGIMAEVLAYYCEQEDIGVAYICDNNASKTGKTVRGLKVISVTEAVHLKQQLLFLVSVADIQDIVAQLESLGQSRWVAGGELINDRNLPNDEFSLSDDFVQFAFDALLSCHNAYIHPDGIFLRSVDLVITERCSLRCRDCSNLMQYYSKPVNRSIDEVMGSINGLCQVVDQINEIRLIGGEPFMNKDIFTIIERLLHEPKVHRIVIFTNGSIVPADKWNLVLANPKLFFVVTDYGELIKNTNRFVERLRSVGSEYYVQPPNNWTDCSRISEHHRSNDEQAALFNRCCAKYLFTMIDGKLFRCPFAAHIDNLGASPVFENDYVSMAVLESGKTADEEKNGMLVNMQRKKLREYIQNVEYLRSCDYCDGRFLDDPKIEPARQTEKPITYELKR